MSRVTFVRPESDNVEMALSSWASLIRTAIAGKSGLAVSDLQGPQVTRATVTTGILGQDLVVFFAHGQRHCVGDPTPILDLANVANATGAIVIAFSCFAGDQLGRDAIASGVAAFLGFDDKLTIYHPTPALFGHHVEAAVQPLVMAGQPIGQVLSDLRRGFQAIETHYTTGPGARHHNANLIWMAAHINWRGLQLHGNQKATI